MASFCAKSSAASTSWPLNSQSIILSSNCAEEGDGGNKSSLAGIKSSHQSMFGAGRQRGSQCVCVCVCAKRAKNNKRRRRASERESKRNCLRNRKGESVCRCNIVPDTFWEPGRKRTSGFMQSLKFVLIASEQVKHLQNFTAIDECI